MLLETTLDDLNHLGLSGMAQALRHMQQQGQLASHSFLDGLGFLTSQEKLLRENRKYHRLLKSAKLRFEQACIEAIDYTHPRELQKQQIISFIQSDWVKAKQNIIFMGAKGLGKSFIACALGQYACRQGYSVRYFRLSKLIEELRLATVAGSLSRFFMQLAKINVLIIDDWGIEPLSGQQRQQLLEIIEDRYHLQSTLITTQLPIEHWHEYVGDSTIADALLDRLLPNAHIVTLRGQSMRKSQGKIATA